MTMRAIEESAAMRRADYDIRLTDGLIEKYRFSCRGDEPLLAGIRRLFCEEIPRGCAGGGCGICKVVVKRGEIDVFKPMSTAHVTEDEITQNVVLACCVNPRSDLEISFFDGDKHGEYEGITNCSDDRNNKN
jgi:ferredoxin